MLKRRRKDWVNQKLSDLYSYSLYNVIAYAPPRGGVYYLFSKQGNTYSIFYIGQSKNIRKRLVGHIGAGVSKKNPYVMENDENVHKLFGSQRGKWFMKMRLLSGPNSCINEHVEKYKCFFQFVKINSRDKRNKVERQAIAKYKPICNISAGISKKATTVPSPPRRSMTNTMQSFLQRRAACWGTLYSTGTRLCSYQKNTSPVFADIIGEWRGNSLIIPGADESTSTLPRTTELPRTIKYRIKLRAMAIAQGIINLRS